MNFYLQENNLNNYIYKLDDEWIIFYKGGWRVHSLSKFPHIFNIPLELITSTHDQILKWQVYYSKTTLIEFQIDTLNNKSNVLFLFPDKSVLPFNENLRLYIYESYPLKIIDNDIIPMPTNNLIATYKGNYPCILGKIELVENDNIIASLHPYFKPFFIPDNDTDLIIVNPKDCIGLTCINQTNMHLLQSHNIDVYSFEIESRKNKTSILS